MTNKPKTISDTARALLTAAATRGDYLIRPPKLPIAATRQVVRSLLSAGLAEEVPAPIDDAGFAWRTGEDGSALMLRTTALGIARVGEGQAGTPTPEPVAPKASGITGTDAGTAVAELPPLVTDLAAYGSQQVQDRPGGANRGKIADNAAPPQGEYARGVFEPPGAALGPNAASIRALRQSGLRQAAQALLDAWNKCAGDHYVDIADSVNGHFSALRSALAATASVSASNVRSRSPRDTKQAQVLAMLRRDEGASGPQIADAMGWAPHTVRGFLAGLAKKGIKVDVLKRVRQVGPDRLGAKGSYTVYRITGSIGG
jgi:hypothetical protein